MIKCWASSLGDCGDEQSREHLVTESIWTQMVDVQGLVWCKEAPKRIGIASLTQKLLCRTHNSRLSDVDTTAKRAFEAIGEAADLTYRRNRQMPHRRWKRVRFSVDGLLLERWFLKTTINLAIAQKSKARWGLTGTAVGAVPPLLVKIAFGVAPFSQPMGLYSVVAGGCGEQMTIEEAMSFAPLLNGETLVGGMFTFRGLRFLVYVSEQPPPQTLMLADDGRMSEWRQGNPMYRMRRTRWQVGKYMSHYIDYEWPNA